MERSHSNKRKKPGFGQRNRTPHKGVRKADGDRCPLGGRYLECNRIEEESKAKLEAALESMSDAVFISDSEGEFVDFNSAFATYHRFKDKDECYKTLAEYPDYIDVYFPDGTLAPLDMWAVPRALRGETVTNAEYMLLRKDTGEAWWGSYNFAPIKDKTGRIVGSVVTGRDITERKRAGEAFRRSHDELELRIQERTAQLEATNKRLQREIEEREKIEHALSASEKRYRSLFETSQDAIFILDEQTGRFIAANDAACRLYGYTEEEFLRMKSIDVSAQPEETRAAVRNHAKAVPLRHHRKKDGTLIHVEIAGGYFKEGKRRLHTAFVRDITKRVRMEADLKESEQKYRSVFYLESDALFLVDKATGSILDVNEAACHLYGYTKDELLQLNVVDVSAEPKETRRSIIGSDRRVNNCLHRKKDGSIFPVDISQSYFILGGRSVVLGATRDITERKKMEEELIRHRDSLEELVAERAEELEMKSKSIEELNAALKVLLRQVQEEKEFLEQRFISNIGKLVVPYLERMKSAHLDGLTRSLLSIMETNLNEIMSPFLHKIQSLSFTPRETEVANLVKNGKSTKEIAAILSIDPRAVEFYRNNVRKKLGLSNKKVNLRSYLDII